MKTKISTKDLLSVFNPTRDSFNFNGTDITIKNSELKPYVLKQTEKKIYKKRQEKRSH